MTITAFYRTDSDRSRQWLAGWSVENSQNKGDLPFFAFFIPDNGPDKGLAVKMAVAISMETMLFIFVSIVWAHRNLVG